MNQYMAIMSDKMTSSMEGHGIRIMSKAFGGLISMIVGCLVTPI